jgi:phosphatidate cytidylyltransferase
VATVDAPAPGRAGRNLPIAVGVGLLLAGLVLVCLYVVSWWFVVLACAAVVVAVREVVTALAAGRHVVPWLPLALGSVLTLVAAYLRGPEGVVVGFTVTVLAVTATRLVGPRPHLAGDLDAGVLVTIWVPLLASFAMLMLAQDRKSVV